jgi:hypothetical protein
MTDGPDPDDPAPPPSDDPETVRWLASEDESAPAPWSALGAFGQLALAVIVVVALVLAALGLAGAVAWIFR